MADERINIEISATDNVTVPARAVVEALDSIGDKSSKTTPKTEALDHSLEDTGDTATELAARLAVAEKKIKSMGNEAVKSAAKIKSLERQLNKVNRAGLFGKVSGGSSKEKGMFGAIGVTGIAIGRVFKLILIPAIFDAVGALATLGSAAGAMAAGAMGALGPLTGLIAAYPGYLAAIGQAFAAIKLGIKKSTFKDLNEPFKELKRTMQDELAPGFADLTRSIKSYMPMVQKALVNTAGVLRNTMSRLSAYMEEAGTQSAFRQIMQTNNRIIQQFSNAGLSALRGLVNVLVAAGPMLTRFAQDFARFMDRLAVSSGDRASLIDFFDKTYTVTKKLITFTTDLSVAFFNIFKQGTELGSAMGDSFLSMAANFRRFTESVEGKKSIANWFATMKPIIWEVGYLIRDLSKALASVSMDKSLLGTLQTLRNDTLPALTNMLQAASGKFLPALSRIIGTVARIMTDLKIGPVILSTIATALEAIASIIESLPGPVQALLGYMVTFSTLFKFGGFFGFFNLFGGGKGNMLANGISNIGFAFKSVAGGAATAGEAVGFLGKSLMGVVTKFAPLALAAAVAAIGISAWNSDKRMREMHKTTVALNDELRKTSTLDAYTKVKENVEKITADLKDNQAVKDSLADIFNPSYWLRGDTWGDAFKTQLRNVATQITTVLGSDNPIKEWFDKTFITSDEQRVADINAANEELRKAYLKTNQLANDVFGTGSKSYAQDSPELKRINDISEALGGLPEDYIAAQKAVMAYNNVNYKAVPAVKDLYGALTTLGDAAATSASKLDAFGTVFTSLRDIMGGGARQASVAAAKAIDQVKNSTEGATVSMKNGKLVWDAAAKSNWALNDALYAYAPAAEGVAIQTFKQTNSVQRATAAYRGQYRQLVKQLTVLTGNRKEARLLANEYMSTPKQVKTVFESPGLRKLIEQGASLKEIMRYIKKNGKVKPKFDLGAAIDTQAKMEDISALQQAIGGYTATPTFAPIGMDDFLQNLKDVNTELSNIGSGGTITIKTTYTKQTKKKKNEDGRELGGPVFAGQQYLVGEAGPEAFISAGGIFKMVGAHGPERRTFPSDGVIVPNYALDDRVASALAGQASTRASGTRQEYAASPLQASVHIGTINAHTEFDVIQAVKKGIREAERNARERK